MAEPSLCSGTEHWHPIPPFPTLSTFKLKLKTFLSGRVVSYSVPCIIMLATLTLRRVFSNPSAVILVMLVQWYPRLQRHDPLTVFFYLTRSQQHRLVSSPPLPSPLLSSIQHNNQCNKIICAYDVWVSSLSPLLLLHPVSEYSLFTRTSAFTELWLFNKIAFVAGIWSAACEYSFPCALTPNPPLHDDPKWNIVILFCWFTHINLLKWTCFQA